LTDSALKLFGLDGKKKVHPHDLNRSERRRLGLASVFAMDTPVIILDEPTLYQDSYYKQIIKKVMDEGLEKGKTILCITHERFYM
jgi:energy-coupling factor transport system ATP-binding protein